MPSAASCTAPGKTLRCSSKKLPEAYEKPVQVSHDQQQHEQQSAGQEARQEKREFATAEDLFRFDAEHTEVPPQVAERLKQSLNAGAPPPRRSWWRNLFGQ